jgi:hypothetical protein
MQLATVAMRRQQPGDMMKKGSRIKGWRRLPVAAGVAMLAGGVHAIELDTGNPDLVVRWDNTVKYSAAARVKSADPAVLGSDNANGDDGDRNFGKGVVSNRFDLFSEADVVWKKRFGARVSAAAWYDTVYNQSNDNPGFAGGAFPNSVSVPANEFTSATRDRMGRKAEILDAFVFGGFDAGEVPVSIRLGQHALTWGESLFFGGNATAGSMMPVDTVRLISVPGTQFKEAIRPVPMLSGSAELTSRVSLGAYYQFDWSRSVVAPAGSYLSNTDFLDEGGETLFAGPGPGVSRMQDREPKKGGQGGIQLRYRGDDTDYGVYLTRHHEKTPQLVVALGAVPMAGVVPVGYYTAYHQGVTALAFSANRTFGNINLGAELGYRRNASLASQSTDISGFAPVPANNVSNNPAYATGNTAHLNLSMLATLPSTPLWNEASLAGEVAWNRMLSVTKNRANLDPNSTRDGVAVRFVFEPSYRGVLPGWDISIPIGLGWAPKGSRPLAVSSPNGWIAEGGGDASVGINATLNDAWRFSLSYTNFFGKTAPVLANGAFTWKQTLRDRDFISASVRYTF